MTTADESIPVAIGVCTYRRPALLSALLERLVQQTFASLPAPEVYLIVVDNEGSEEVKEICTRWGSAGPYEIRYYHEPRRGISQARNKCLDMAPENIRFFAFIDDDELPEHDWLDQLLRVQAETQADIVLGPVIPEFSPDTPAWIARSGFFKKPRNQDELVDRQPISFAATCNVLIRWQKIQALHHRFDPDLGLSGGEDKLFFQELRRAGCQTVWAARARVFETVPPDRARLSFMLRSEYKGGNVRLIVRSKQSNDPANKWRAAKMRYKAFVDAVQLLVQGAFSVVLSLATGKLARHELVKQLYPIATGLGMLTSAFGNRYQHYR